MTAGDIARIAPVMSSVALLGHNLGVVNKKKKTTGDLVKMGITNVAGIGLIRAQSQIAHDIV